MITVISNILEWIAIAIKIKNKTDLTLPLFLLPLLLPRPPLG